jgi:sugar phosphate isomerase/epimerase
LILAIIANKLNGYHLLDRKDFISGFNVFNSPIEDYLEYSSKHNLKHIEINLSKSHSSLNSFDLDRIKALKERINALGITISLHLPNQINIADNISRLNKKNIKYLIDSIELANSIGAKYINLHLGFFFWFPVSQWQRDKALLRFITNIGSVLEKCEEKGVTLALENVTPLTEGSDHYLLGDNIKDFVHIFTEIDSPWLKFCLDTGHANLSEGVNEYISAFSEKLISVHYHDNNGSDDSHLIVGEGNINWTEFWDKINSGSFKGPFISECRGLYPHEAANKLFEFNNNNQIASPVKS